MTKINDPFGFTKAIDIKAIDNLEDYKLDQIAKMFDLSPDDFSDDKADLRDLAEQLENN